LIILVVNGSSELGSWRISQYASYHPNAGEYLKAGDVIRLFHKEYESYLTHEKVFTLDEYVPINVMTTDLLSSATGKVERGTHDKLKNDFFQICLLK